MGNRKPFRIGDWLVQPDLNRLALGDKSVTLRPQAMELLVYLAERSPAVSSIDDIIENVWAGRPMTTGPVYNCLNELRKAFDDDKQNPRYIETIARRGYRLIAPIAAVDHAEATGNGMPAGSAGDKTASGGTLSRVIIAGLVAILAIYGWEKIQNGKREPGSGAGIELAEDHSIAVLPFIDLSPEGDQEYLALGITEEILNTIAGYPDLKVVGRTSSFQFRDSDVDLRDVGRQLGVSFLVEGSVRRAGDQLRITAQLIQASDGFHVWSKDYDAKLGQVFQIQDEIAASVAGELLTTFGKGGDSTHASGSPVRTVDFNAYDLLLLARTRVNGGTMPELEEAIGFLEQALEIDPGYSDVHAELAYAYVTMKNMYRFVDLNKDWSSEEQAMAHHADLALELDPLSANAHFVKASVIQLVEEGANSAERLENLLSLYTRAIELNPNHARAYLWLSGAMRNSRQSWKKRLEPARKAMELDPLWPFAKQFYLSLIGEIPELRREKWELLRELKASQDNPEQLEMTIGAEADNLVLEGRYAEALTLGYNSLDEMTDNGQLQRAFVNTFYLIGSPQRVPAGIEYRFPALTHLFPGESDKDFNSYSEICQNPERTLFSTQYVVCAYEEMLRGNYERSREILEDSLEVGLLDFTRYREWHRTMNEARSPTITMAFLEKLDGNLELAMAYADIEEGILNAESENGAIESPVFDRTRARIHAIRGEIDRAIDELEKVIARGRISFRIFMEPVFNDLHGNPRYESLKERWIGLVNDERAKLGWEPLALNPDSGPSQLPFLVESTD